MSQFKTLKIKEVIRETPNAVSLVFDIPENLKQDFSFIPGQFVTLKSVIDGEEYRRAYSISSKPTESNLRICIKKVENGKFSTFANTKLKPNDTIEVMPPEGKFRLKTNSANAKNYIAFAAGSGITPIIAMIKSVISHEPNSKFVLVYGNKNITETIYYNELNTLKNEFKDQFFVEYVFSQENVNGFQFGRIDKSIVNLFLKNKYKHLKFDDFYLCGPEAMINVTNDVLLENGLNKESIHIELFTTTNTLTTTTTKGTATLSVVVDDDEITIEVDKQITLLDSVLKHDVDAPYSCKGGVCCSCICRVVNGEANMPENNMLTDAEIEEGLILACQAFAVSDTLKIDFDDA